MQGAEYWRQLRHIRNGIPDNVILDDILMFDALFQKRKDALLKHFDDPKNFKDGIDDLDVAFTVATKGMAPSRVALSTYFVSQTLIEAIEEILGRLDVRKNPGPYAIFSDLADGIQLAFGMLLAAEDASKLGYDTAVIKVVDLLKTTRPITPPTEATIYSHLDQYFPQFTEAFKQDPTGFLVFDSVAAYTKTRFSDLAQKFVLEGVLLAGDIYRKVYPAAAPV